MGTNESGFTVKGVVIVVVVLAVLVIVGTQLRSNGTITGVFVSPTQVTVTAGQQAGFYFHESRQPTLGGPVDAGGRPIRFKLSTPGANQAKIVAYQDKGGLKRLAVPTDEIDSTTDASGRVTVFVKADATGPGFSLSATDTTQGCIGCTEQAPFSVKAP